MFICNNCLEEKYTNSESFLKSTGKCELCDNIEDCSDIPSYRLERKEELVGYMNTVKELA